MVPRPSCLRLIRGTRRYSLIAPRCSSMVAMSSTLPGCSYFSLQICEVLLSTGVDVNVQDSVNGWTALMQATHQKYAHELYPPVSESHSGCQSQSVASPIPQASFSTRPHFPASFLASFPTFSPGSIPSTQSRFHSSLSPSPKVGSEPHVPKHLNTLVPSGVPCCLANSFNSIYCP